MYQKFSKQPENLYSGLSDLLRTLPAGYHIRLPGNQEWEQKPVSEVISVGDLAPLYEVEEIT